MLKLNLEVTGNDDSDIERGVLEALSRIQQGNTSGFDRNESGSFHFEIEEES